MRNRAAVYCCYLAIAVYAAVLTVTGPLLTEIATTFSLGMAQSGMVFSANFIGFVVFISATAFFADRAGKKRLLFIALAGMSAALFGMYLAQGFTAVCILLFFTGGFSGVVESMASALLSEMNTENPEYYVNISQVFFGAGALIGPVAAGAAVSAGAAWQQVYLVLAFLMMAVTLIFSQVKIAKGGHASQFTLKGIRVLAGDWRFLLMCLCMFFYSGSEVGSWGWMSTFLSREAEFAVTASGTAVSLFWGSIIVGRLICGHLTHKCDIRRIIAILAFITAIALIMSAVVPKGWFIWLVIVLMGLGYSSQWPFIAAYGGNLHKEHSGAAFAILIGSCGAGMAVIPGLLGIIGEKAGMRAAMGSPAVLMIVIGFVFLIINPIKEENRGVQGL